MKTEKWQLKANKMYFEQHMSMSEIADETKITRQTISKFLKSCDGFAEEKACRKAESVRRKKEYQKSWYTEQKSLLSYINKSGLKAEHFEAVKVLSYEKF